MPGAGPNPKKLWKVTCRFYNGGGRTLHYDNLGAALVFCINPKARDQRLAITSLPGPWVLSLTVVVDEGRDKSGLSSSVEGGADHVHIPSADCLEIHRDLKRTGSIALRSD
ncbi:hypothetical protein SADUNF_Sadunf03G0086100 [Salix dunnii]|uniref:Uncharacterized protein n=1 Tax=Salix dunnii TaxID=1413687 RepID=A0A835N3D9_9ROSI|nr:hypothetical protein SADUNF_Sadunf03G0086100 [Salix dunnii]